MLDACDGRHLRFSRCETFQLRRGIAHDRQRHRHPGARAARRVEVVRPRRGAAVRQPARRGRLDPRADRRERRRQVDPRQGRRRSAPPRRRGLRAGRRGGRLLLHRRLQGGRRRGDLPGADALPRPVGHREHLHGPPAADPRPPHRPARDDRRGRASLRPPRRPHRPAPPGGRPVDRRPADHRDRQGHLARRPPAGDGRADRRAQRSRGRAALRGRPQPPRRGPRPGLHLPPLRRGLRPRRHRHRDARRLLRRHATRSTRPRRPSWSR